MKKGGKQMSHNELSQLQTKVDNVNLELLKLINKRGQLVQILRKAKENQGIQYDDSARDKKMLDTINEHNDGPFERATIEHVFREIFKVGLELHKDDQRKALLVSRKSMPEDTVINLRGEQIGDGKQHFIFGPCSVESYEQVAAVAKAMKEKGLRLLRGGAYKPRSSPYDFQGLGVEGLKILKSIADKYDMAVISEIVDAADLTMAADYLDVIQIGSRNMQNYELLKAVGRLQKPVLLKRGLAATIKEFINAAEYIMSQGNGQIILCERGIRTYETATRNTLDITAVPILKQETHLPVFVDITHSTGRRDLLLPAAKAAMAIGADGIMAEVHPDPAVALSDSQQQMDLNQFDHFFNELLSSSVGRSYYQESKVLKARRLLS